MDKLRIVDRDEQRNAAADHRHQPVEGATGLLDDERDALAGRAHVLSRHLDARQGGTALLMYTVFDLISEHALISGHPPFFFFFSY